MPSIQEINRNVDALRYLKQDLGTAIDRIRRKHRRGITVTGQKYLRLIREASELQDIVKEQGVKGPLVEDGTPIPYRDQLVGFTAAERKALEWRWVSSDFPFSTYRNERRSIPSHYKIAAE